MTKTFQSPWNERKHTKIAQSFNLITILRLKVKFDITSASFFPDLIGDIFGAICDQFQ